MGRLEIHCLALDGEIPSKKNSRINTRRGRSFPSRKFQEWHSAAVRSLERQWGGKKPLDSPCLVAAAFFHSTRRRRDSDNQLSSVLDTLVDAGVLKDDNCNIARVLMATSIFGAEKDRALLMIRELDESETRDDREPFSGDRGGGEEAGAENPRRDSSAL